ncbi:MAG: transposase, partial [Promethearchaeota archaeon]
MLLFDPSMVSRPNYVGIGRPKLYEDKFYGYLYILMHLYDLTHRGLEGFLYCIAPLLNIVDIPNFTTIYKHCSELPIELI